MSTSGTALPELFVDLWVGAYLGGFLVWCVAVEVVKAKRLSPKSTDRLSTRFALITAAYVLALGVVTSAVAWPVFAQCFAVHLVIALLAFAVTRYAVESHRSYMQKLEARLAELKARARAHPYPRKPLPRSVLVGGFSLMAVLFAIAAAFGTALMDLSYRLRGLGPRRASPKACDRSTNEGVHVDGH